MDARKPLIVYVSGASGSGKSTIAANLASQLYIPHVSSDLVLSGVKLTSGDSIDRQTASREVFVPLLENMARSGVSFVVDSVLYKNMSEIDIISHLLPVAVLVNVHTVCNDPIERFYDRESARTDKGVYLTAEQLNARRQFHEKNLENTAHPLNMSWPIIQVDTTDGYEPSLMDVIEQIDAFYDRL